MFDRQRAIIGAAMLMLNVTMLYLSHTFGSQLLTLFVVVWLLYLFTSAEPRNHRIAALLLGLSLSIGFWPFVLLIAIFTVGLNLHHTIYTPRSKQTFILFGLILLGAASYLVLEIFYFGASHLWGALVPTFYPPRGISLIAQGLIIAVFSINVLLWLLVRRKSGKISRDFQSVMLITVVFFLINLFSREDLLHDVAVIVPCLVLIALDKIESIKRFAIIYLAINVGIFFLMPSFQTDPEIASAKMRRVTSDDEISFSYYRSSDLFSYQQLLEQKTGEEEARELLASQRLDSTIILITPGTDTWFDAGTLGTEFPNAKFGWFYGTPVNMVRMNGLIDTTFIRPSASTPYLSGLFEKSYARKFIDSTLPASAKLHESERFQYIDCRGSEESRKALIDEVIALQYQGFHH